MDIRGHGNPSQMVTMWQKLSRIPAENLYSHIQGISYSFFRQTQTHPFSCFQVLKTIKRMLFYTDGFNRLVDSTRFKSRNIGVGPKSFQHVNKTHPKCRKQIALHPATEEVHCESQQAVLQHQPWEHCKSDGRSCSHRGRSACCHWGGGTDRWAWQQNNSEASPPICPRGGPL